MPHTDKSGAETPDPTADTMDTAAAQRVEQERLTRRAALRKLGFGAGIAAFSLLGVDDFARMVGQRLQRNAHDNKTAMAVAKEFQSAGIASAGAAQNPSGTLCVGNYDCSGCGGGAETGDCCAKSRATATSTTDCCQKSFGPDSSRSDVAACRQCCGHASPNYGAGELDDELRRCSNLCGNIV